MTKSKPAIVLIKRIFANPTPAVLRITDELSAKNPMNGNTIIAKIKETIKL